MPKEFMDCVKNGGSIKTISINKKKYAHVCIPKGGGPSVMGEMKTKKGSEKE